MSQEEGRRKSFRLGQLLKRQEKKIVEEDLQTLTDEISEITKAINDECLIDRGSFGEVYGPYVWRKMHCAIKRCTYSTGSFRDGLDDDIKKKREMWTTLSHGNLILILEVFLNRQILYIVMEYADGGSLRKALDTYAPKLPIKMVWSWTKQIADGMFYLHSNNIVHRDLKSSNVLLEKPFDISDANTEITLKIADFDEMREHNGTLSTTFIGTLGWMAPEVLMNKQFSKSSDVWSFGVVVWEMITGHIPHEGRSLEDLVSKAKSKTLALPLPKTMPANFDQLLTCKYCFGIESDDRPSFQSIKALIGTFLDEIGYSTGANQILQSRQIQQKYREFPKLSDEISEIRKAIKDECLIDKGAFGEVYGPFFWRKKQCAVKRSTYSTSSFPYGLGNDVRKKRKMWSQLLHRNLIRILEVFKNRQALYTVMEYAEGGSLRKALNTYAPMLSIKVVWNWSKQIADGMFYLHSRNIVHRDLKSSNA